MESLVSLSTCRESAQARPAALSGGFRGRCSRDRPSASCLASRGASASSRSGATNEPRSPTDSSGAMLPLTDGRTRSRPGRAVDCHCGFEQRVQRLRLSLAARLPSRRGSRARRVPGGGGMARRRVGTRMERAGPARQRRPGAAARGRVRRVLSLLMGPTACGAPRRSRGGSPRSSPSTKRTLSSRRRRSRIRCSVRTRTPGTRSITRGSTRRRSQGSGRRSWPYPAP